MNAIAQQISSIPPITRVMVFTSLLLSLLVYTNTMNEFQFTYIPSLIYKKFQVIFD